MNKELLRNCLFDKYFENQDGILASELVNFLSFIPETWKKLHKICEENIKYFDSYCTLSQCKIIHVNKNNYLFLKLKTLHYVIIDLKNKQNISKQLFEQLFDSDFLVCNFNEPQADFNIAKLCIIDKFDKPEILIDFYYQHQQILNLSKSLKYMIFINNAWTYFIIDFVNAKVRLGFQTPNQFLYEHLFLNYDLTASTLQDVQPRIGIEKMDEMFARIKLIKIPLDIIPNDLYEQYSLQRKLVKKIKYE